MTDPPPIHTDGRPIDPGLAAAMHAAHPEAVQVARAATIALYDDDPEAFARAVSGFLAAAHPDRVQFCARFNALLSVLLGLAAEAAIHAGADDGPGDLICLAPASDADAAERAAVSAVNYAASGDTAAAMDVLFVYKNQLPDDPAGAARGAVALLSALTAIAVALLSGDIDIIEQTRPRPG